MITGLISAALAALVISMNVNLKSFTSSKSQTALICVSDYTKHFTFGFETQVVDFFWIRFLQELDAYNQLTIAEPHLCPDKTSSWHFHLINVAFDLDKKFYELYVHAPLLVSITIGDVRGGSVLFDKSVEAYPNSWTILYRAAYQAMIEEKNKTKAAALLYRAGKNGAPGWVMSLAGGLYNESGDRRMAEQIYSELLSEAKDSDEIGNDNGLCESNEDCIYTPNFGSYQGTGDFYSNGTCIFQNGTISGVQMYAYPTQ